MKIIPNHLLPTLLRELNSCFITHTYNSLYKEPTYTTLFITWILICVHILTSCDIL